MLASKCTLSYLIVNQYLKFTYMKKLFKLAFVVIFAFCVTGCHDLFKDVNDDKEESSQPLPDGFLETGDGDDPPSRPPGT